MAGLENEMALFIDVLFVPEVIGEWSPDGPQHVVKSDG